MAIANNVQNLMNTTRVTDFIAPLGFRLYLAPIMIAAGLTKFNSFESTAAWFGNPDWGLGLPFPEFLTAMAAGTELIGGLALLIGLAVRWFAIPLMFTMAVAAFTVHWDNGWFAVAPSNPATSMAKPLADIGIPAAEESLNNSEEVGKRLRAANSLLERHGNAAWLKEKGNFVVLNNGIEFAVTYFLMLLSLFFTGAGRYLSIDYWISRAIKE